MCLAGPERCLAFVIMQATQYLRQEGRKTFGSGLFVSTYLQILVFEYLEFVVNLKKIRLLFNFISSNEEFCAHR